MLGREWAEDEDSFNPESSLLVGEGTLSDRDRVKVGSRTEGNESLGKRGMIGCCRRGNPVWRQPMHELVPHRGLFHDPNQQVEPLSRICTSSKSKFVLPAEATNLHWRRVEIGRAHV